MTGETYQALKLQVMRHEGLRLKVYQDSVGIPTLGYGRNVQDKGITEDEATFLLENDLDVCVADCETFPWFELLNAVRQRVIVDMRFNLGGAGLRRFKNTLRAVEYGRYEDAADGMLASQWAKQTKTRAVRLAQMMRTGREA